MALANRELIITFTRQGGRTFGGQGGGSNQVTLKGSPGTPLWASCQVVHAGALAGSELNLAIYGMSQSLMNQLSTLGIAVFSDTVQQDLVTVQAVTAQGSPATVYIGTIISALADFNAAPEVPFRVTANSGLANSTAQPSATSFKGTVDVAAICQNTFLPMLGLGGVTAFENNGVNVKLNNPYFWGSPREQAFACAAQAGIGMDDSLGVLSIWSSSQARSGAIPVVGPTSGLKQYPTFTNTGIIVETLYNPDIKFNGQIKVESALFNQLQQTNNNKFAQQKFATIANGQWLVIAVDHSLDTTSGGAWFSTCQCVAPGNSPIIRQ
jgi:hypothetical protein